MTEKEMLMCTTGVVLGFCADYVCDITNPKIPNGFPMSEIKNGIVVEINDNMAAKVLETLDWLRKQYEGAETYNVIDLLRTLQENEKTGNICCTVISQGIMYLIETADVLKNAIKTITENQKGK